MLRAREYRRSSWIMELTNCETCSGLLSVSIEAVFSRCVMTEDGEPPCVPCRTSFICASSFASSSSVYDCVSTLRKVPGLIAAPFVRMEVAIAEQVALLLALPDRLSTCSERGKPLAIFRQREPMLPIR